MKNSLVSQILDELADYAELEDDQPYRARAYRRAANTIESLQNPIENVWQEGKLKDLPGVGENIERKIDEIIRTGRLETLEKLKKRFPSGLLELKRIEGVGPKTIRLLHDEFGIRSLDDLERAIETGKLGDSKILGIRSEQTLLSRVQSAKASAGRILLAQAAELSVRVTEYLKQIPHVKRYEIAGSFRRRKETIGDFDVLMETDDPADAIKYFTRQEEVKNVLVAGESKASVKLRNNFQVDARVISGESWGAALVYFTGSKSHNVELRTIAMRKGLRLNEYGLFRSDGSMMAGETEEEVYMALGLDNVVPELRENPGEIEAAGLHELPKLLELRDIKGDLQMHTTWSDGRDQVKAMADKAIGFGYEYIAITDHVGSLRIANAMNRNRIEAQKSEIEKINAEYSESGINFHVMQGAEVNIRSDGTLDVPDSDLKDLEMVLASIHSGFGDDREKITRRILSAMENEHVDIIAHPTGRLLLERKGYDFDFAKVVDKALETGTLLEIDAHPNRLDLSDENARTALKAGVMLSLDTDAHDSAEMGYMRIGVRQARRAWARREDILNTRSFKELARFLEKG